MTLAVTSGGADVSKFMQQHLAKRSETGDCSVVEDILRQIPDHFSATLDAKGNSTLHLAVRAGQLRLTRELLAAGAKVDARDEEGRTPLHLASEEQLEELAIELVLKSADVNAKDGRSQTPLHKIASTSTPVSGVQVARVLLESGGADPTRADDTGATPLLLAARGGCIELVQYMVSFNPTICSARDSSGWSALHLAAQGREVRKQMLENRPGKFARVVNIILGARADVDILDEDKKTPLHRAASSGNCETCAELLQGGASINAEDICRWTPLHYACEAGHLDCVKLFLAHSAAIESLASVSALALATMEDQVKVVEVLLKHRADPHQRSGGHASPMMIARGSQAHAEIASLFELGWIRH